MIRTVLTIIGDIIGVLSIFGMLWIGLVAIHAIGG